MPTTEAAILERIIELDKAEVSPEVARYLLSLDFPQADRQRLEDLISQEGALSPTEQTELENYRHVIRLLDRMRFRARQVLAAEVSAPRAGGPGQETFEICRGIRRSQEAYWRDLPQLLKAKKNHGKWVAYHGDERIGIARNDVPLIRECLRRGIKDDEYVVTIIRPRDLPPWEPEEVEPLAPHHFDEDLPDES